MNLRQKILLMAIIPLVVAIAAISLLVTYQSRALSEQEIALFEEHMLAAKKAELINYISLALTSISHIYADAEPDDANAKARVKAILDTLTYGPDGYFFVYDYDGNNLVHPKQTFRVGHNWWNLKDANGDPVIQHLIARAREGGGFHRYLWQKPSTGEVADKIGYAVGLDKWHWMLGTGIYIDDVVAQVQAAKSEVENRVGKTFVLISAITLAAVMAVFVAGIVINLHGYRLVDTKLKALTQRIIDVQEEERGRVARELHDGISQILVGVKYALGLVEQRVLNGSPEVLPAIEKSADSLNLAIAEVRRISKDLRPSMLDDLGLSPALESLVNDFSKRTGIETEVSTVVYKNLLPSDAKTALYRVAQEALTNIERHAQATRVQLSISGRRSGIFLRISDNGVGFDPGMNGKATGIGLRNMQERMEYFDGKLRVFSSPSGGTIVEARLPKKILLSQRKTPERNQDHDGQAENQSSAGG